LIVRFRRGVQAEVSLSLALVMVTGTGFLGRSDSIVCSVADSGPGIEVEEPERIFDPVSTTKAPGEGTGLGLANARRLAQELGGSLEVDLAGSELGGALFHLVLPAEEGGHGCGVAVRTESMVSRESHSP
jgi:signal transduction histidine kinase